MPNKPLVITFLGSIGVGKSFFARQLAERQKLVRLNADALRLAWYGSPEEVIRNGANFHTLNPSLFRTLDYIMREVLPTGTGIIADVAQFNKAERRQQLHALASECGATVVLVWIKTPRDVIVDRVSNREERYDQRRISREEAETILDDHDKGFAPPTVEENVVEIDGTQPFEVQYSSFIEQIQQFSGR